MYKYYIISKKPFWKNNGVDFPHPNIFQKFLEQKVETSEINLNFESQFSAAMTVSNEKKNDINYIIVHDTVKNEYLYYFKNSIRKLTSNTIVYNLELDFYATYGIKLFDIKNQLTVSRCHIKEANTYQFSDSLLEAVPKKFKENREVVYYYPKDVRDGKIYYQLKDTENSKNSKIVVNDNDKINSNVYYVFSKGLDNSNNEFVFVPVLSQKTSAQYIHGKVSAGAVIKTLNFSTNSDIELNQRLYDETLAANPNLVQSFNDSRIPSETIPRQIDIRWKTNEDVTCIAYSNYMCSRYRWTRWMTADIYVNGRYLYSVTESRTADVKPGEPGPAMWYFNVITMTLSAAEGDIIYTTYNCSNNLKSVNALKDRPDLINNFVGVFFLPNILNFYRKIVWVGIESPYKNFLVFTADANGLLIDNFNIASFSQSSKNLNYNSTTDYQEEFIKYFQLTYYNKEYDWNYFMVDGSISIGGLFIFNGNPNIACRTNKNKVMYSIIAYPYQLPSSTDTYVKYYSQNMSSINNGIKQQEIQYNLQKNQLTTNTVFGALGSVIGLIGSKGGTALKAGQFISDSVYNYKNLEVRNQAFYDGLKAQWDDIKRVSGTNFNPSNINDSSNIVNNFDLDYNSEVLEMLDPDDQTLIQMNNTIYFYGWPSNSTYTIKKLTEQYKRFNYVKVVRENLRQIINSDLEFDTNNIYDLTVDFWSGGVRVWNTEQIEYLENELNND